MAQTSPADDPSAGDVSADASSADELSFEDALDRLEAIVEQLEDDPPALAESLDAYEEGVSLANACLKRLNEAEQRISELDVDA
jgi:exodeoxyribonuclease VII small subunit